MGNAQSPQVMNKLHSEFDPLLGDLGDICEMMLTVNPSKRPSARELMEKPFFKNEPVACSPSEVVGDFRRLKMEGDELNEFFARERIKAKIKKF
jgi:hypothetical protein